MANSLKVIFKFIRDESKIKNEKKKEEIKFYNVSKFDKIYKISPQPLKIIRPLKPVSIFKKNNA